MAIKFEDPQSFLAKSVFDYLAPGNTPQGETWARFSACAKRFPEHFIVRERVPGVKDRYLSIGPDSDYPRETLDAPRCADSVVAATLVKRCLVSWAAIDWLADILTKALGRKIWPEQIRHSGLKDRWAITTQTIVIFGVTPDELKKVNWPCHPGKAGFFLKDIRWHDGRVRIHPSGDDRRNRVYTEIQCELAKPAQMSREAALALVRQQLNSQLGRNFKTENFSFKGAKNLLVISHLSAHDLAKVNWPQAPGVSLSSARIYKSSCLSKGDHRQNLFQLKVLVKDKDVSEVENYLSPLMSKLERLSYCIPNAINWQRLAARQLGHLHGYTLITGDYKAPAGVHAFGNASEAALYRFLFEVSGRENPAAEQLRRDMEPCWLYDFNGMRQKLERSYRQLNLSVEYKIVERLADNDRYRGDFQEVVRSASEEVSMWAAAWQSWWWNQVLARKLPHWVREMEEIDELRRQVSACQCPACTKSLQKSKEATRTENCRLRAKLEDRQRRFSPLQRGIPLLMDSAQSKEYYGRLSYCQDALVQLGKADEFVRRQFLTPRGDTPWRKAFIKVESLNCEVSQQPVDGNQTTVVDLEFVLPSGAYATTFVGLLFELEEPNKGNKAIGNPEPCDEETE